MPRSGTGTRPTMDRRGAATMRAIGRAAFNPFPGLCRDRAGHLAGVETGPKSLSKCRCEKRARGRIEAPPGGPAKTSTFTNGRQCVGHAIPGDLCTAWRGPRRQARGLAGRDGLKFQCLVRISRLGWTMPARTYGAVAGTAVVHARPSRWRAASKARTGTGTAAASKPTARRAAGPPRSV